MSQDDKGSVRITRPGILAFGVGLPPEDSTAALFQDDSVSQISCGFDHSAVVLESGRVYIFGKGQGNNPQVITTPTLMTSLSHVRIVQAACGFRFTLFLADNGEVYSCGENDYGQLGLGHERACSAPVLVPELPAIKKVAAGSSQSLALTESGQVWASGCGGQGQLGLGHNSNQTSFVCVPNLPETITDISCGSYHSAVLSASGALLMTGRNMECQLGLQGGDVVKKFTQVLAPSPGIAAVSCGGWHTMALRVDESAWAWGLNDLGQLGTDDHLTKRLTPAPVIGLEGYAVADVIAGYNHSALLTKEGDVLLFDRGENSELGQGKKDITVPTLLWKSPELIVQQVAFADTYTLLLVRSRAFAESKTQNRRNRAGITEMEKGIMKSLECPVCLKIMSSPILQCYIGHSVCITCRSTTTNCPLCREPYVHVRSIDLENLSTVVDLPCVDCLERMPASRLEMHYDVCPDRKYSCPFHAQCGWNGQRYTMVAHTSSAHPNQTWQNLPHLSIHSFSIEGLHTDVLTAHSEVFTLHQKVSSSNFQAVVRYIGPPENANKFMFEITFVDGYDDEHLCRRKVCDDVGGVEDKFQSPNCVTLTKELLESYLRNGKLVCEVNIVRGESKNRSQQIEALLRSKNVSVY